MDEILITKIVQTSTGVVLIPNRQIPQANLSNLGNYKLRLACGLKATNVLPIYIQTSAGNLPVLCKYGNLVYSNQIKTRKYYNIGYGNGNTSYANGQFIIFDCICRGTIVINSNETAAKGK